MKTNNALGTAVVTGASSGLGKVFAEKLAARGYNLKLVARRGEKLIELAEKLRATYGVTVTNLVADLSAASDLEKVASDIQKDTNITLLINNAGTSTMAPIAKTSIEKQKEMVDVNITSLMVLTHAILPSFIERNEGTIINIGSVLGAFTLPISSVYSGTKGFVVQYTRGLQEEVKGTNIKVQLVNPSITATEIWEVGGVPLSALDQAAIMTTEDCVDAALAGLEAGESATFPSVHNQDLIEAYEDARIKLFTGSQTGKPAERYLQN